MRRGKRRALHTYGASRVWWEKLRDKFYPSRVVRVQSSPHILVGYGIVTNSQSEKLDVKLPARQWRRITINILFPRGKLAEWNEVSDVRLCVFRQQANYFLIKCKINTADLFVFTHINCARFIMRYLPYITCYVYNIMY